MTTSTVIVIGYSAVVLLLTVAIVRVVRKTPQPTEQQRVDAARARVGLVPPAPDNRLGIDTASHDECELIWELPSRHPGLDRLRWAIRDEQQKGDQ